MALNNSEILSKLYNAFSTFANCLLPLKTLYSLSNALQYSRIKFVMGKIINSNAWRTAWLFGPNSMVIMDSHCWYLLRLCIAKIIVSFLLLFNTKRFS